MKRKEVWNNNIIRFHSFLSGKTIPTLNFDSVLFNLWFYYFLSVQNEMTLVFVTNEIMLLQHNDVVHLNKNNKKKDPQIIAITNDLFWLIIQSGLWAFLLRLKLFEWASFFFASLLPFDHHSHNNKKNSYSNNEDKHSRFAFHDHMWIKYVYAKLWFIFYYFLFSIYL